MSSVITTGSLPRLAMPGRVASHPIRGAILACRLVLLLAIPSVHAATYCTEGIWANAAPGYNVSAWFGDNIQGWACVTNPITSEPTSSKIEWNITRYGFLHEGAQRDMEDILLTKLDSRHWAFHSHTITNGGSPAAGRYYTALYGWIWNPTIEFYIIDNWFGERPIPTTEASRGQIMTDGGTYDIYYAVAPKGWGQWWSIRTSRRTSGTINYGAHILKWRELSSGMSNALTRSNTCLDRISFALEPKWGTSSKGKVEYWKAQINK